MNQHNSDNTKDNRKPGKTLSVRRESESGEVLSRIAKEYSDANIHCVSMGIDSKRIVIKKGGQIHFDAESKQKDNNEVDRDDK